MLREEIVTLVQRFRAALYMSAALILTGSLNMEILALSLALILSVMTKDIVSLNKPSGKQIQKVQKCFWPPDLIPYPHLPHPPKKDDLAKY